MLIGQMFQTGQLFSETNVE